MDITSNKLNLKFIPLLQPNYREVYQMLPWLCNNTYASQAGLNIKNAIILEDKNSPYVNLIVAKTKYQKPKLIDLLKPSI